MSKRTYILYDERAMHDDDEGQVVEAGLSSRQEAEDAACEQGWNLVCWSYKLKNGEATDGRFEFWSFFAHNSHHISNEPA